MDALIAAAARALAAGDVLGALQRVALREAPAALALRGIAMAQLGEYARSRELLRRAARAFGAREALARARCVVAEAEVALAMRDLAGAPRTLAAAVAVLEAHGDRANALQARLVALRRLLLLGRLVPAAQALAALDLRGAPPALLAVAELAAAELALRGLRPAVAQAALARAEAAAQRAGIVALQREVAAARAALEHPAARRVQAGEEQPLRLAEVVGVDGFRRAGGRRLPACRGRGRSPGVACAPAGAVRAAAGAGARLAGRCRPARADRGGIPAARSRRDTSRPAARGDRPAAGAGGRAGRHRRHRAGLPLAAAGRVHAAGQARARRWLAPGPAGFATILLLPVVASPD